MTPLEKAIFRAKYAQGNAEERQNLTYAVEAKDLTDSMGFEPQFAAQVVRDPVLRKRFLPHSYSYHKEPKVPFNWGEFITLAFIATVTGPMHIVLLALYFIGKDRRP